MKKAKKYTGCTVKIENNFDDKISFRNITQNFKKFKEEYELFNNYTQVVSLEDANITLYKCAIYKVDNVAQLFNIRKHLEKRINYDRFYTKSEIEDLLIEDFVVCVKGLQEIDIEDLEKLI